MKNCPFCRGEIAKDAIKCKYCGEWLVNITAEKPKQHGVKKITEEDREKTLRRVKDYIGDDPYPQDDDVMMKVIYAVWICVFIFIVYMISTYFKG